MIKYQSTKVMVYWVMPNMYMKSSRYQKCWSFFVTSQAHIVLHHFLHFMSYKNLPVFENDYLLILHSVSQMFGVFMDLFLRLFVTFERFWRLTFLNSFRVKVNSRSKIYVVLNSIKFWNIETFEDLKAKPIYGFLAVMTH